MDASALTFDDVQRTIEGLVIKYGYTVDLRKVELDAWKKRMHELDSLRNRVDRAQAGQASSTAAARLQAALVATDKVRASAERPSRRRGR